LGHFTLLDVQLSIPDKKHMQFSLSDVSGGITLDIDAGITGPIPIHRKDNVKGTFSNMNLKIIFEVKNGNAVMSKIHCAVGKISINFGKDELANLLSKLFMPVFKANVEFVIPSVILLMKHKLDFQHLMGLLLKVIPETPLPNTTIAFEGFDIQIDNGKIDQISAAQKTFSIEKENELVFDMNGIEGIGHLVILVGKPGMENMTKVDIAMHDTSINFVSKVVGQEKKGDLEIDYVSSKLNIGELTLVPQSTDPVIVWLANTIQPLVESILESGFDFLIRGIFEL